MEVKASRPLRPRRKGRERSERGMPGAGWRLALTIVIPAQAGIQRGGMMEVKASRPFRPRRKGREASASGVCTGHGGGLRSPSSFLRRQESRGQG